MRPAGTDLRSGLALRARTSSAHSRRGGALVAALAISVTVAAMCAALLQQSVAVIQERSAAADQRRVFYVAEAGIAEAVRSIRSGGTGNIGSESLPARFGDGAFWTNCEIDEAGCFHIESTAVSGRARASLSQVAVVEVSSPTNLGIFGEDQVVVESGAWIGPYDSENEIWPRDAVDVDFLPVGPSALTRYALLMREQGILSSEVIAEGDLDLVLGSNGSIQFESGNKKKKTVLKGDAIPGPDGEVELGLHVKVEGVTAPRSEQAPKPDVVVPELEPFESVLLRKTGRRTLDDVQGHLPHLILDEKAQATISGGSELVIDRLELRGGSILKVDAEGGPIKLWVRESLIIDDKAKVTTSGKDPTGLSIVYTGGDEIDLDGDGDDERALVFNPRATFRGSLYAPEAHLEIAPKRRVEGAVAGKRLTIGERATIHFDNTLLRTEGTGERLRMMGWQVLESPAPVAGGVDALAEVERACSEPLPLPCAAEQSMTWGIVYENKNGRVRKFFGEKALFNFNRVGAVIETFEDTSAADVKKAHTLAKRATALTIK